MNRTWVFASVALLLVTFSGCSQPSLEGVDDGAEQILIERPDVFWADPNVIQSCDDDLGRTTVYWKAPEAAAVEVHVGSPQGALFSAGGSEGSAETRDWVKDRMVFYLINADTGDVLATTRVRVTREGCPEASQGEAETAAEN